MYYLKSAAFLTINGLMDITDQLAEACPELKELHENAKWDDIRGRTLDGLVRLTGTSRETLAVGLNAQQTNLPPAMDRLKIYADDWSIVWDRPEIQVSNRMH